MFWMYGRVGGGFALIAGLAALVVYLRRTPAPSGWMIVLGALVTAATVMLSWSPLPPPPCSGYGWSGHAGSTGSLSPSPAGARWGRDHRRLDPRRHRSGRTLQSRRHSGGRSVHLRRVPRQPGRARPLLPVWFLVLVIPALAAGLVDHRTRAIVAVTTLVAAVWTFAPQEGAMTHNFWNSTGSSGDGRDRRSGWTRCPGPLTLGGWPGRGARSGSRLGAGGHGARPDVAAKLGPAPKRGPARRALAPPDVRSNSGWPALGGFRGTGTVRYARPPPASSRKHRREPWSCSASTACPPSSH